MRVEITKMEDITQKEWTSVNEQYIIETYIDVMKDGEDIPEEMKENFNLMTVELKDIPENFITAMYITEIESMKKED